MNGRPRKVTAAKHVLIHRLARLGIRDQDMAADIGVCKETVRKWRLTPCDPPCEHEES